MATRATLSMRLRAPPPPLESGDDPLGGAHALGELALAEADLGAKVVDELTEREVVFDPGLTAALLAKPRGTFHGAQL